MADGDQPIRHIGKQFIVTYAAEYHGFSGSRESITASFSISF
jgi:hypothetical protein